MEILRFVKIDMEEFMQLDPTLTRRFFTYFACVRIVPLNFLIITTMVPNHVATHISLDNHKCQLSKDLVK